MLGERYVTKRISCVPCIRTPSATVALPERASGTFLLHLLWRGHAEQAEAASEHGLGGGAQGEAAGANVRVVHENAVDRVELVEARGEGFQIGRDRVDLPPRGAVLDHAWEVQQLQHEQTLLGREISCWEVD